MENVLLAFSQPTLNSKKEDTNRIKRVIFDNLNW